MPSNPIIRVASTPSHRRSGPSADGPHANRTERDAEQRDRAADGVRGRSTAPSLSFRASDGRLTSELYGDLWRRQEPRPNRRPSYARQPGTAPDSGMWPDQLLAEIESLIAELKEKVARFALFRSLQYSEEASGAGNEAALESMNLTLEDIAAAALGIELASHEGYPRISSAPVQALMVEIAREQESGSAG
jgi:hypothetical protein